MVAINDTVVRHVHAMDEDGIYLKRNWEGAYENEAILVAIGVNEERCREALGAQEGMKEDKASWLSFFQ